MQPDDKLLIYGRIKTVLFPHLTREQGCLIIICKNRE